MRLFFFADAFADMQVLPNFHGKELVPPSIWRLYEQGTLDPRWYLQPRALELLSSLREEFGPLRVNDWSEGGDRKMCGYRPPRTGVGAEYSQHKLGAAWDIVAWDGSPTPGEIREAIMEDEQWWYDRGLRAIEDGEIADTWVHVDVRPTQLDGEIKVVRP